MHGYIAEQLLLAFYLVPGFRAQVVLHWKQEASILPTEPSVQNQVLHFLLIFFKKIYYKKFIVNTEDK